MYVCIGIGQIGSIYESETVMTTCDGKEAFLTHSLIHSLACAEEGEGQLGHDSTQVVRGRQIRPTQHLSTHQHLLGRELVQYPEQRCEGLRGDMREEEESMHNHVSSDSVCPYDDAWRRVDMCDHRSIDRLITWLISRKYSKPTRSWIPFCGRKRREEKRGYGGLVIVMDHRWCDSPIAQCSR